MVTASSWRTSPTPIVSPAFDEPDEAQDLAIRCHGRIVVGGILTLSTNRDSAPGALHAGRRPGTRASPAGTASSRELTRGPQADRSAPWRLTRTRRSSSQAGPGSSSMIPFTTLRFRGSPRAACRIRPSPAAPLRWSRRTSEGRRSATTCRSTSPDRIVVAGRRTEGGVALARYSGTLSEPHRQQGVPGAGHRHRDPHRLRRDLAARATRKARASRLTASPAPGRTFTRVVGQPAARAPGPARF